MMSYSISVLKGIRFSCPRKPTIDAFETIKDLGIFNPQRGCRSGVKTRVCVMKQRTDQSSAIASKITQSFQQDIQKIQVVTNGYKSVHKKHNTIGCKQTNLVKVPLVKINPTSTLNIGYMNARSINNKTTEINEYICDNNIHVLALTETWLTGTTKDDATKNEIKPAGYEIAHLARKGRKGGGVGIIYRGSLKKTREVRKSHKSFEAIELQLSTRTDTVYIVVVYRTQKTIPKTTMTQFLEEVDIFLDTLIMLPQKLLIVGDFNVHWDIASNTTTKNLKDIFYSKGLNQHINKATQEQGHTLDLVLSRADCGLVKTIDIQPPNLSDHSTIIIKCNMEKPAAEKKTIKYRKLKDIDAEDFRMELRNSQLVTSVANQTVDELVEQYNSSLSTLMQKHAPMITREVFIRDHSPWYTEEVKGAKRKKRRAERRYMSHPSAINSDMLKIEKAGYAQICKQAKMTFYHAKLKGANSKIIFRTARDLLHQCKDTNLPTHDNTQDLSNDFVNFFKDKIEKITTTFPQNNETPQMTVNTNVNMMREFQPVSEEYIRKLITSGKKKSCHLDPIPTSLLIEALDILLPTITNIVNKSISENTMPQSFKSASVTPLLKKPSLDIEDKKNYRPVSNLPYLSKIIEKAIVEQLNTHLTENNLHRSHQSAYRKGHSTETALLKIMNDLLKALDKQESTLLVLLDQSAAFDTVNQDLLLNRLNSSFGIDGNALQWLTSYFKGRQQRITIKGVQSDPVQLTTGFPQGSVLGPFAYPIYTSPLFDITTSHNVGVHMYADDTQLYASFKTDNSHAIRDKLEGSIADIKEWMVFNHLKLNESKTEYMVIRSARSRKNFDSVATINIGNSAVTAVGEAKNIGVTIDAELTMSQHISNVCRTCNMHLHSIGKIRVNLTKEAAEIMINALITSRLDYANGILYKLPKYLTDKLQKVQNNSARLILRKKKRDRVTPMLVALHWLPIRYRIKYKINLITFKTLHDMAPQYLKTLLKPLDSLDKLRSANKNYLQEQSFKTNFGLRAFSVSAPKLWKKLPQNIRDTNEIAVFKAALKEHYCKIAYKKRNAGWDNV